MSLCFCRWIRALLLVIVCALAVYPQDSAPADDSATATPGIQWAPLLAQSLFFTGIEHGFRIATQDYTRQALKGKFFPDWGRSIGNFHGWGDGDPFLTNYVGHPMQGAVAGFIFVQNDPKYRQIEFGRDRNYWKSRARATLYSFAYSEQFEVGPLSEASLGNAQAYYPQQGFLDQVITPTVGLLWMVAEDAMDRYLIERLETRTQHRWLKMMLRSGLNPSRSMANAMRLQVPWHRDSRPGIFRPAPPVPVTGFVRPTGTSAGGGRALGTQPEAVASIRPPLSDLRPGLTPTFELATNYSFSQLALGKPGTLACNGGGAEATYNLSAWFGLTADVGGCKMKSPGVNISGDSTNYLLGPRFSWRRWARWTPYLQTLAGGNKFTTETFYPNLVPAGLPKLPPGVPDPSHSLYTKQEQTNALALEFGGGLNFILNRAVAINTIEVADIHTWARSLNGTHFPNNLRVTTGVTLRFGNW